MAGKIAGRKMRDSGRNDSNADNGTADVPNSG